MFKCFLSFLLIFFALSSFCLAKDEDAKLKAQYGQDLTQAPYFLRYAFYKAYHKDWKYTFYSERKAFLKDYEANLAVQTAQEKAEARAEAAAEKEREAEKKAELRKERDRLKAELAEERAEKQAERERQKAFDNSMKQQEEQLHQMEEALHQ